MLARHLRSFLTAFMQPRIPAPDAIPRLQFVYATEGAAARYRVFHGVEASQYGGIPSEVASLMAPERLYRLHQRDILIMHRVALGPRTLLLLLLARKHGLKVVFDTDDLVWDVRQREYEFLDQHYSPTQVAQLLRTAHRTLALMRQMDAIILSTPYLAQQAHSATQRPVFVLQNAVSQEMQQHALAAFAARTPADDRLRIGYFSGHARVHDEDLASVGTVLARILAQHPQVIITLVGEVALPHELTSFIGRIERRSAVDWRRLPHEIARVDIAIAPLIDNPQRRSKSGIKYLEAALVGVPTVAVDLDPYQAVIQPGVTGMLAHSPHVWHTALHTLITDPALRTQFGNAARQHVLAEHTTNTRAPQLATIMRAMMAGTS